MCHPRRCSHNNPAPSPRSPRSSQPTRLGRRQSGFRYCSAKGGHDLPAQLELTETLLDKYCELGGEITLRTYPDIDHEGVIDAGADDILEYITARYDHLPAADDCP